MSGFLIAEFDLWRAGYAGASVAIYDAGTNDLADVFSDDALTVPAANPQTLLSLTSNGVAYGKFAVPLYVADAYEMIVNSTDQTGVMRPPLVTLEDEDASGATVRPSGGSEDIPLEDLAARQINVLNQGEFLPVTDPDSSSSTNNATLVEAIGIAAAAGGGEVITPAGTFLVTSFTVPAGVLVRGQGRDATVLQSSLGDKVVTAEGSRAGLADLTLDGLGLYEDSVGFYALAQDETRLENVLIKNFETGLHSQGGVSAGWRNLSIDNCTDGAKLHGDEDLSDSGDGDEFRHNRWYGGMVTNCAGIGVELKYVDKKCWDNAISVGFQDNTGTALKIVGARDTRMDGSWFDGNGVDIDMADGDDVTLAHENTVVGFTMRGGIITGDMNFTGKCQDVLFDKVNLESGTYTLTTVGNSIVARDCLEGAEVVLDGNDATQFLRCRTTLGDSPTSVGLTTGSAATEAWSYDLAPGERVVLTADVIANGRNVNDYAVYKICQGVHRPGSTLAYDGQTVNFTLGDILTGATSGATARIIADSDSGATGTLTLRDIDGEFVDDEDIEDESGGIAIANGVLAHQNAVLLGSITSLVTAVESDATFAAIFGVTAGKARVLVTGASAKEVEWAVAVQVTSG